MADVDLRREPASRRRAIRKLATLMAGSPLLSLVDANGDPVQPARRRLRAGRADVRAAPPGAHPIGRR